MSAVERTQVAKPKGRLATTVKIVSAANNSDELKKMLESEIGHLPVSQFRLQEIQAPRTDIKMFLLFIQENA